MGNDHGTVPKL